MRLLACLSAAALLSGCVAITDNSVETAAPSATAATAPGGTGDAPDSMRWLYGSGEAAAAYVQAFKMMADFVKEDVDRRDALEFGNYQAGNVPSKIFRQHVSVMMGSTEYDLITESGGESNYISCLSGSPEGTIRKPYAVVFDIDETVLLNTGYEYWQASTGSAYDSAVWDEWERTGARHVVAAPGAVDALERIRAAGVTVVFNSNRNARNAAQTAEALRFAGLGEVVHGETLFLKGDDDMGSAKDGRRRMIGEKYCVIALAGDNLGDFTDALNDDELSPQERRGRAYLKATVDHHTVRDYSRLWGNGWFLFPNPVYGASIKGSVDEVFPPEQRWTPANSDEGN